MLLLGFNVLRLARDKYTDLPNILDSTDPVRDVSTAATASLNEIKIEVPAQVIGLQKQRKLYCLQGEAVDPQFDFPWEPARSCLLLLSMEALFQRQRWGHF